MKCETVDENKGRVFSLYDRTTVGVVEDDIISNRQSGHCGRSNLKGYYFPANRRDLLSMARMQCINIPPHDSNKV